ncbi:MAG: ABC transporter ATP-binding protein [Oscillospiraceae bacterium]|nr:ABC transporter ATP-binding protein [Oscillospiraceae bacterium]
METILRLENVDKAFGGVIAAKDVSFSVQRGEIMGLIGPNGAGKTTLLNLISGIYKCDGGNIYIGETNVTRMPSHNRPFLGLARTFQTPRFLQRSSIRDNLFLGTDLADKQKYFKSFLGIKGHPFEQDLNELMELAGFSFNWDDDILSIPYGQRKRLEIVRALLTHPKVMLVDEPAAGLNSAELEQVIGLLQFAAVERNVGVVLIEHRMDMVMNTCHNIVVLNFGVVIAHGEPDDISSNPEVIEAYLGRDEDAEDQQS